MAAELGIVSIHAPAGGATKNYGDSARRKKVSIHAPAGGATGGMERSSFANIAVSIHAPAGGATADAMAIESALHWFQSTRPRGARLLSIYALNSQYITYTISRTFSFASLLIYYSIYFFCKYFITRFCDPTSFLATLHVRVH